jgi:hypothetical protein
LTELGYACTVLGDEFSPAWGAYGGPRPRPGAYPQWDGPGTVRNVRNAVRQMVQDAGAPEDRLVFVTSSHGCGDGRGASYLCLLPDPQLADGSASEREGSYMDHELAADLGAAGKNLSRTTVFLDACFSGGIIEELLDALPAVMGTTTCTRKGYGYDNAVTQSGAWTNRFLTCNLRTVPANKDADLALLFQTAVEAYVKEYTDAGDRPCFFGRTPGTPPCNTELRAGTASIPRQVFMLRQWL